MKKWILGSVILLSVVACESVSRLTQFTITHNTSITIPSSSGLNLPFNLYTPDVETNSSQSFENNNTRADLVEEVSLRASTLTITSPSNGNFDFLKSIEVYISAENEDEVLIAERQNIQDGVGQVLELQTTGANLKDYITKSTYDLRINVVTDQIPGSDVEIDVENEFWVDANVLGL